LVLLFVCFSSEPILFDGLQENHTNFNYRRDNSSSMKRTAN
jgi:hypothetical protein